MQKRLEEDKIKRTQLQEAIYAAKAESIELSKQLAQVNMASKKPFEKPVIQRKVKDEGPSEPDDNDSSSDESDESDEPNEPNDHPIRPRRHRTGRNENAIRFPQPGKFDPSNRITIEDWLFTMNTYLDAQNVRDRQRIPYAVLLLEGHARIWWKAQVRNNMYS